MSHEAPASTLQFTLTPLVRNELKKKKRIKGGLESQVTKLSQARVSSKIKEWDSTSLRTCGSEGQWLVSPPEVWSVCSQLTAQRGRGVRHQHWPLGTMSVPALKSRLLWWPVTNEDHNNQSRKSMLHAKIKFTKEMWATKPTCVAHYYSAGVKWVPRDGWMEGTPLIKSAGPPNQQQSAGLQM